MIVSICFFSYKNVISYLLLHSRSKYNESLATHPAVYYLDLVLLLVEVHAEVHILSFDLELDALR